jgi:hypothetical protein
MQQRGRIIAVQEQRFRFQTDSGQVLQLTLARGAPLDGADLLRLQARNVELLVDVTGKPNLTGGVARNVLAAR